MLEQGESPQKSEIAPKRSDENIFSPLAQRLRKEGKQAGAAITEKIGGFIHSLGKSDPLEREVRDDKIGYGHSRERELNRLIYLIKEGLGIVSLFAAAITIYIETGTEKVSLGFKLASPNVETTSKVMPFHSRIILAALASAFSYLTFSYGGDLLIKYSTSDAKPGSKPRYK